jgi:hypothetical protein
MLLPVRVVPESRSQSRKESLPKQMPCEAPAPVGCGVKSLRSVGSLLHALHAAGTERDRVGTRQLFYDH